MKAIECPYCGGEKLEYVVTISEVRRSAILSDGKVDFGNTYTKGDSEMEFKAIQCCTCARELKDKDYEILSDTYWMRKEYRVKLI